MSRPLIKSFDINVYRSMKGDLNWWQNMIGYVMNKWQNIHLKWKLKRKEKKKNRIFNNI